MIGAVKDRPGQIVETGIQQIEPVLALPLDRTDLGHQVAALGHEITAGLDLQADGVTEAIFQPLASGVPEAEIGGQIDVCVARADRSSAGRRRH